MNGREYFNRFDFDDYFSVNDQINAETQFKSYLFIMNRKTDLVNNS